MIITVVACTLGALLFPEEGKKMQDSQGLLLVLGMAVVTYLHVYCRCSFCPRTSCLLSSKVFDFVPYAVLTSSDLSRDSFSTAQPASAIAGGLIALVSPIADRTFL